MGLMHASMKKHTVLARTNLYHLFKYEYIYIYIHMYIYISGSTSGYAVIVKALCISTMGEATTQATGYWTQQSSARLY